MMLWHIPPSDDLARILMDGRRRVFERIAEPVRLNRRLGKGNRGQGEADVERTYTAEGLE